MWTLSRPVKSLSIQGVEFGVLAASQVGDAYVAAIRAADVATQQQRSRTVALFVAEHLDVSSASVRVFRNAAGAPKLELAGQHLHLSLARRDDVLLIGLAPRPVGVDLERLGTALDPPWRVLAPEETAALSAMEDRTARHEAFLRLWTVKEAALKALGTGFAKDPAATAVAFECGEARVRLSNEVLRTSAIRVERFSCASDRFVWACVVL